MPEFAPLESQDVRDYWQHEEREFTPWLAEEIDAEEPSYLEDYKQSTWRWAASRWLENKYGVVEASDAWPHIYERTARGDAVSAALQELSASTADAVVGLPDDEKLRKWLGFLHRRQAHNESISNRKIR